MSSHILIFYGTSYGQTAKVARCIADRLTNGGVSARLIDGDYAPQGLSLEEFDGVIIGASVIRGRHQRCVRVFVRDHVEALNGMPSAFFSVSGSAASRDTRGKLDAQQCIDNFLNETGWHPILIENVAGAMAFTKYNPLLRWMLKQISRHNGGPTDTSRDHEFTDWAQVHRFAETFIRELEHAAAAAASTAIGGRR